MKAWISVVLVGLATFFSSGSLLAQTTFTLQSPSSASPGQNVNATLIYNLPGPCNAPTLGDTTVQRAGTQVVVLYTIGVSPPGSPPCVGSLSIPLGAFQAGTYDILFGSAAGGPRQLVGQLLVADPTSVPTLSELGLTALALLIGTLARSHMRKASLPLIITELFKNKK